MFVSDVFKYLKERLDGGGGGVPELDDFFLSIFDEDLPDTASAYVASAASFLIKQLTIWDKLLLGLDTPAVADVILSSNGGLRHPDEPEGALTLAIRRPVTDGHFIMDVRSIAESEAFEIAPAPGAYLIYIVSDVRRAEIAVKVAADQTDIRFPVAVMVKLALPDCDRFISVLSAVDHRVAGWLNILEADGRTNVVALVIIGGGTNEI